MSTCKGEARRAQAKPARGGCGAARQLLLQDEDFIYDIVGNPTEIRDWRDPEEWPAGAKPVTKKIQYDDLYRATKVSYQYSDGDDDWVSPFDYENEGGSDPRRANPAPHQDFEKRILEQTFRYDWLGNNEHTDDDAHGFYDRSLGSIQNDSNKPYQLASAAQHVSGGSHNGDLTTTYDDAGNLTELTVNREGACLPAGANCNHIFKYEWDEVGRLVRAQRFDGTDANPAVDLRNYYDASDQRVIKRATVGTDDRFTLYVFDTLELRGAEFGAGFNDAGTSGSDYEYTEETAVPYLLANGVRLARVMWEIAEIPALNAGQVHVFFELGDHLGSTSVVLDQATGELVERSTFQAYGGAESDYRPSRWAGFREDYRFTGKEEDVEVGLQYFGKRFLNPLLGRWVSADPLTVHVPGEADWNLYAYVHGSPLRNVDPLGLDEEAKNAAKQQVNMIQEAVDQANQEVESLVAERAKASEAGDVDAADALTGMINDAEQRLVDLKDDLSRAQKALEGVREYAYTKVSVGVALPGVGGVKVEWAQLAELYETQKFFSSLEVSTGDAAGVYTGAGVEWGTADSLGDEPDDDKATESKSTRIGKEIKAGHVPVGAAAELSGDAKDPEVKLSAGIPVVEGVSVGGEWSSKDGLSGGVAVGPFSVGVDAKGRLKASVGVGTNVGVVHWESSKTVEARK